MMRKSSLSLMCCSRNLQHEEGPVEGMLHNSRTYSALSLEGMAELLGRRKFHKYSPGPLSVLVENDLQIFDLHLQTMFRFVQEGACPGDD